MSEAEQQKLESVKNYCSFGTVAIVGLLATITYFWTVFAIDKPDRLENTQNGKHETIQMSVQQVKHQTAK